MIIALALAQLFVDSEAYKKCDSDNCEERWSSGAMECWRSKRWNEKGHFPLYKDRERL